MSIQFNGTGVALVTPFLSEGGIDHEGLSRLVEYVIAGGVDYLVPLGSTGESSTLTEAERIALMETVITANSNRKPILMGCGGNNTHEIAEKLQTYSSRFKGQIHGFLSVSPAYNKPSQDGIIAHYQALALATDLPIMIYNVPGRTASHILPETVLHLANNTTFLGIKEASGSVEPCVEILFQLRQQYPNSNFGVFAGDDLLALPMIAAGARGCVSVIANVLPKQITQVVNACLAQDFSTAQKLYFDLYPFIKLTMQEGNPRSVKTMLECIGLQSRNVRLPLVSTKENFVQQVQQTFIRHFGDKYDLNRLLESS